MYALLQHAVQDKQAYHRKGTAPRSERVTLGQSTTLRLQQRLSCTMSAMTRSPHTRESIKAVR